MSQQKQLESTSSHESPFSSHGQTTDVNTLDLLPPFLVPRFTLNFLQPSFLFCALQSHSGLPDWCLALFTSHSSLS